MSDAALDFLFGESTEAFLELVEQCLSNAGIDVSKYFLDHVCYRVESGVEYEMYCKKLSELSDLLSEITIGGRKVSTYKLHEAYKWKGREIPCVELPQPKASSFYSKGLEHVEFVIDKDFATFMGEHPNLEWDTSGSGKSSNPDIALKFKTENKNISVKFHHKPLERVIEEEQKEGITEVV